MNKSHRTLILSVLCICLSACMAKDIELSDQQKRMQRCDQYIDRERDACLRGETITIEEYQDELRKYEKSRAKEAENTKYEIEPFIGPHRSKSSETQPPVKKEEKPIEKDESSSEDKT